ncbi:hypothetical protein HYPSUDRAFT_91423 [Hypholoma sublateritium FD-334 SS-4]|uniref:DUF6534 domain-containing protein n=1 Tax=Hypholoma sublateritium (strain FD-334 SS-4) TaxID=945553 RepID=A0A0D2KNT0_HYPSF|nr:hypothetical protein HYPSUDRAFT_91423 [Hypholoma sublateritium FD-334 SS-4]
MGSFQPDENNSREDSGPLFLGFMVGSILFGVALLQAYQYFMNYTRDSKRRKIVVVAAVALDTIHLGFSAVMMYLSLSSPVGLLDNSHLWTLKGFATIKLFLIILVQSYYLSIIWQFASSFPLHRILSKAIKTISIILFLYAIGMGIVFLTYLERDKRFFDFSKPFQTVIFIAFGSTAVIDSAIAGTLSFLLLKTDPGRHTKSRGVIKFLVLFFIGTGLLTAIMAVTTISVYAARPSTALYLSIEFAVPRLYVNSILAMFNSKAGLQKRMNATSELKLSSLLLFDDLGESSPIEENKP